jgi:hypothetical protein
METAAVDKFAATADLSAAVIWTSYSGEAIPNTDNRSAFSCDALSLY